MESFRVDERRRKHFRLEAKKCASPREPHHGRLKWGRRLRGRSLRSQLEARAAAARLHEAWRTRCGCDASPHGGAKRRNCHCKHTRGARTCNRMIAMIASSTDGMVTKAMPAFCLNSSTRTSVGFTDSLPQLDAMIKDPQA